MELGASHVMGGQMTDETPQPDSEITIWDVGRPNVQAAARPFRAEWQQHDLMALSRLTTDQRQAQRDARHLLLNFVLNYYKAVDNYDELPPEWESVAAMVDLLTDMVGSASMADDDPILGEQAGSVVRPPPAALHLVGIAALIGYRPRPQPVRVRVGVCQSPSAFP